jgi:hypothetical protein
VDRARARASTRDVFFARTRDALFVGWNESVSLAPAFCATNFVLEAATRIGGIKLGTARSEPTTRARAANTFPISHTAITPLRARPHWLDTPLAGQPGVAPTWKATLQARDMEVRNDPNARQIHG